MNEQDIRTLKDRVDFILETIPPTRNSDKLLTIHVWQKFHSDLLDVSHDGQRKRVMIPIEKVMDLPSQDGIKRVRADIQNVEKRFPPTDPEIAKERGWLEDEWKKALGYSVGDGGQTEFHF